MGATDVSREYRRTSTGLWVRDRRDITVTQDPPVDPGGGGGGGKHPVFGAAVSMYPESGRTSKSQEYAAHETDCGPMGIYRSYTSGGIPSSWTAITGDANPRLGDWENRWSWHSFKPDPQALAAGSLNASVISFCNTIPVTGMKRLLTAWHEFDVGTKIPNSMSAADAKALTYQFCKAVHDSGHPDVLAGPCMGSKDTFADVNSMLAATSVTTAALLAQLDFVGWDPYNEASYQNNYTASRLGAAGVSYYFDPIKDYRDAHFPGIPLAFGEIGFEPNASNLAQRPAYLTAVGQWCATSANNVLAACYFDGGTGTSSVPNGLAEEHFLRAYSQPRRPDNQATDAWDSATYNLIRDPQSIAAWSALYAANPPY